MSQEKKSSESRYSKSRSGRQKNSTARKMRQALTAVTAIVLIVVGVLFAVILVSTQNGVPESFTKSEFGQTVQQLVSQFTGDISGTYEGSGQQDSGSSGQSDGKDPAVVTTEAKTASEDGGDSGGETQAVSEPDSVQTETAAETETAAPETTAVKLEGDPLAQAKLLAAQYDYDGAIKVLQSMPDASSDSVQSLISEYTRDKENCQAVDVTTVPHVFFHSLINDDRAFNADLIGEDRVRANNEAMTTVTEFNAMLRQMYEAGYVLVSLDDLCVKTQNSDGTVTISKNTNLMLPQGKKALVMSEDDLSYYHSYGIGTQGYATRMVLDENGKVKCEYTDENGETRIGDYDMVPLIDTFIEEHPDFSYHGARPTVALTGYNGVFGYRTNDYYQDINNPNLDADQVKWLQDHPDYSYEEDCRKATEIADAMKAEGWTFASHTYGHLNAAESDTEKLKADNERWNIAVGKIVGSTDKIIFAFGADIGPAGGYTEENDKYTYFRDQGYDIFCDVDAHVGWTEWGDRYMRTGRVPLDGYTMYQVISGDEFYTNVYEALGIHDVSSFFDQNRPTPITAE